MSLHTHDGIKLEILPTLIEVFLRHLSFCHRKTFYEGGYDKIHELLNYFISSFNRLRDKSIGLKRIFSEDFTPSWRFLLNNVSSRNAPKIIFSRTERP